jgi:intraflagellar transport protein 172
MALPCVPQAERYYIKAGLPVDAVDMYSRANRWEAAQKVFKGHTLTTA